MMRRSDSLKAAVAAAVVVAFVVGVFLVYAAITPAARGSGHQAKDTVITMLGPEDIVITHDETYIVLAVDGETVTVRAVSSWEKTRTLARELAVLNPVVVSTKDLNYCNILRHIVSR